MLGSGKNRWRPDLVPAVFAARTARLPAEGGPTGAEWLERLPHLLGELLDEWRLTDTGTPWWGHTAVVVPVERDDQRMALKVVWPHTDALAEPLALQQWGGRAAVHLVSADPGRNALLLERLDATRTLNEVWIDEACEVMGGLYRDLHQRAAANVPRLAAHLDEQLARVAVAHDVLPRRVIERACGLYRELHPTLTAERLLHGDLHFDNVLWRDGGDDPRWVAIDPKPMAGHPGFELHAVLRNRLDEHGTGASFRWSVRHRIDLVTEAAGDDEELARRWTIVAAAIQALWASEEPVSDRTKARVTWNLMLMKALED